jgi:polar amino acid transport system substrate-binding protein
MVGTAQLCLRDRSIAVSTKRKSEIFFAYDRPILAWMIRQDGSSSVELTDVTFEPQSYAIALRNDSALRKPINVALLDVEQSEWWKDILFRYLGQAAN